MFDLHRLLGVALLLALGCGDEVARDWADSGAHEQRPTSTVVRWVGAVEETDVRVAAIVGAGKARLYFCGGADLTATRWFNIPFNSEHLEYQDDTWRIHAHLTSGGVLGEVERASDGVRTFNARAFERGTIAGLYEGKADCGRLGLIVTQPTKNDQPTAQGACIAADGRAVQQVNAIEPIALQDGKIMVRTPGGGDAISLLQVATLDAL